MEESPDNVRTKLESLIGEKERGRYSGLAVSVPFFEVLILIEFFTFKNRFAGYLHF